MMLQMKHYQPILLSIPDPSGDILALSTPTDEP